MVKLESLKKSNHFKLILKEKKLHTDFFSVFAAKNFLKNTNINNLRISFVIHSNQANVSFKLDLLILLQEFKKELHNPLKSRQR